MKELTPHPQADILRVIADGKTVQIRHEDDDAWWEPTNALQYINSDKHKFRIKPETMSINGHEFPAPAREPVQKGQVYFLADICHHALTTHIWTECSADTLWLERGLIHLTREAAIAHAEALLSFTRSDDK